MRKNKGFTAGLTILIFVSIVGYYEFRIRDYKKAFNTTGYILKKDITVTVGQELKANMFQEVTLDRNKLPEDYVRTLVDIENKVALENMYDMEVLRTKKIVDKKDWSKEDERFIWLSTKGDEAIAGNDLRPSDNVDIFIYDPTLKAYILYTEFENLKIYDLKDKEYSRFSDSQKSSFFISNVCFKIENTKYNKLIDKIKLSNNDFKISIHGNRPKVDRVIKQDSSVIDGLNK
jgi:hypothetical protein